MKKDFQKIFPECLLLVLMGFFFINCGGSKPLAKNPATLGIVPFDADAMTRPAEELNRRLFRALNFSGSFRLAFAKNSAQLLNLANFEQPALADNADTSAADSSTQPSDEVGEKSPRWVLTGAFVKEIEYTKRGTLLPYLLFRPSTHIAAELEYRLYDTDEKRWIDIQRIHADKKLKGVTQVLDYNPVDPSLVILAKKRQEMRSELYNDLFDKLIESLEMLTNAK